MNSIIERFEVEKAFKNKIALTFTSFLKKHCVLKSFKQKKKEKKKWINCFPRLPSLDKFISLSTADWFGVFDFHFFFIVISFAVSKFRKNCQNVIRC